MNPYLSLSIHFIDHSWNHRSFCLKTQFMPQNHSGVNIKESLTEILHQWDLRADTKMVALTTDSGSNIKLACQLGGWKWLSCFGHNLDLSVNNWLKDGRIDHVVAVCKKILTAFHHSWNRQRDMATLQEKDLPKHKLISDCATCWVSTLSMLKRIVEQQEAIRVVLSSDRKVSHLIPRWQDFNVMDSLLAVLYNWQIFYKEKNTLLYL